MQFKKPFNKQVGETRNCNQCGSEFHTFKPIWKCRLCQNEVQRKIQEKKRLEYGIKDNYPFSTKTNEAGKRFSKIRVELNKVWRTGDKQLIRQHYQKQLEEAERLGIIQWIYDRRDNESIKANSEKSRNKIRKEYPDTRGHYED